VFTSVLVADDGDVDPSIALLMLFKRALGGNRGIQMRGLGRWVGWKLMNIGCALLLPRVGLCEITRTIREAGTLVGPLTGI
jgi:hypothetical protein